MTSTPGVVNRRWPRSIYELEVLEQRYFLSAGFFDFTFADGGKLIDVFFNHESTTEIQVLVQRDGKILVGGDQRGGGVFIARYNPDGTFDSSFASEGQFTTSDLWYF